MTQTTLSAEQIAEGLSAAQRNLLRSRHSLGNMMGGWFGLLSEHPRMLEPTGINHPIFGSHHCLTPFGQEVRAILARKEPT